MRFLLDLTSRRTTRLLGAAALLVGVGGATMAASSASAAACNPGTTFQGTCTMTGTATLTGGSLGVEAPATQTWSTTLDGTNKLLVNAAPADTSFSVQDATGSGDGWNVTATASPFTVAAAPTRVLANIGTLVFNGSTTSETTGATPGNACAPLTDCTVATPTGLTFPVDFTTDGTTPFTLYNAAAASGLGNILIGSSSAGAPAAWWVNVPASATAGAYASTITLTIASGPTVG